MISHTYNGKTRKAGWGDSPPGTGDATGLQAAINQAASALGMGDGLIPMTGTVDQNTALGAIAVAVAAVHSLGITSSPTDGSFDVLAFSRWSPSDSQQLKTAIATLQANPGAATQAFLAVYSAAAASQGQAAAVVQAGAAQGAPALSPMATAAAAITQGTAQGAAAGATPASTKKWLYVAGGLVLAAAAVTTTVVLVRRHRSRTYRMPAYA